MHKIIFATALWLGVQGGVYGQACCATGAVASCGSTVAAEQLGANHLGLRWVRAPFESQLADEPAWTDRFHLLELFGRWHFAERWSVAARLPLRWNVRHSDAGSTELVGAGDVRLLLHRSLVDRRQGRTRHLLEMGVGVKLPTGRYLDDIGFRNLPGNFNLGTGNFAALLELNGDVRGGATGIQWQAAAQWNGRSRDDYHYGDQYALSVLAYRSMGPEAWQWRPMAGLTAEYFAPNHQPSGNRAEGSGGKGLFARVALGLSAGDWTVSAGTFIPLAQHYADGQMQASTRLSVEMARSF